MTVCDICGKPSTHSVHISNDIGVYCLGEQDELEHDLCQEHAKEVVGLIQILREETKSRYHLDK